MAFPFRNRAQATSLTAEEIATALRGKKHGDGWSASCPAHDDKTPSLAIREAGDTVLFRCHAGCSQEEVLRALRERGLWTTSSRLHSTNSEARTKRTTARVGDDGRKARARLALHLWESSQAAGSTIVETYLGHRSITCEIPRSIRFHPNLRHPSGRSWPAMVALVSRGVDGEPLAIHRTFLAWDGSGKAPVDPPKMMLGPCRGGVVRLGDVKHQLLVGEGIETCLAAMQATGIPAWAALSTSGLGNLELPDSIDDVVILADGDKAGERAALEAADRWQCQQRRVRIARPPQGFDFNDVLMGTATANREAMS